MANISVNIQSVTPSEIVTLFGYGSDNSQGHLGIGTVDVIFSPYVPMEDNLAVAMAIRNAANEAVSFYAAKAQEQEQEAQEEAVMAAIEATEAQAQQAAAAEGSQVNV